MPPPLRDADDAALFFTIFSIISSPCRATLDFRSIIRRRFRDFSIDAADAKRHVAADMLYASHDYDFPLDLFRCFAVLFFFRHFSIIFELIFITPAFRRQPRR